MSIPRTPNKLVLAVVCAAGIYLVSQQHCSAQVRRYQPSSPTVSPYLNLTRASGGGLPTYFALVRPLIQQQSYNQQARDVVGRQQREILALQNDVQRARQTVAPTGNRSWFMIQGNRETFLNSSRYYPQAALTRVNR
jgi:hypothetical protein